MSSEIEKTARQIEEACDKFFNMRARMLDLMEKGKNLDAKLSEVSEEIGKGLKDLRGKSEAIEEAWRLNAHEYESGRIERDGYERRLRQLTEEMSELGFSFRARVCLDLNTLDRQLDLLLAQIGVPSNLPNLGEEVKVKTTAEETKKIETIEEVLEETREKFKDSAVEEKINPESYRRLGVFYAQEKNWKKAEEQFAKAINADNVDPLAWRGLGYAHFQQGNYAQAVTSYKTALSLLPNDGVLWYNLGTAYFGQRQFDDAMTCFIKASEIMPNYAPIWSNIGATYRDMGNYRGAIDSYIKAVKMMPNSKQVWFNLAYAYEKLGYNDAAKKCVKKAKSIAAS
ncbi:MAG: tetratricopeptide repeat protein [Candidatus Bathyarchaeia archaeon]